MFIFFLITLRYKGGLFDLPNWLFKGLTHSQAKRYNSLMWWPLYYYYEDDYLYTNVTQEVAQYNIYLNKDKIHG